MSILIFEDDDLDLMHQAINRLQLCFHPIYAPEGHFSAHDLLEMQRDEKKIIVIADRNIVSPICEIATNGKLNDDYRMRKVALFVTWSKFARVQLSSGLGLYESDSSGLANTSGEENRLQFLHGVDVIPSQIWKALAYGQIDSIPEPYLYKKGFIRDIKYDFNNNLLYLCNEAAMIKITQLIREEKMSGIDKFIAFMNWYADHLDIAESIMVYEIPTNGDGVLHDFGIYDQRFGIFQKVTSCHRSSAQNTGNPQDSTRQLSGPVSHVCVFGF